MKLNMKGSGLMAAALFAAAVLWALLQPEVVPVTTGVVAPRTLAVVIEEQGRTRAQDPFVVAAPISGRLLRPALEAGDAVAAGDVIARIAVSPDDRRTEAVSQANLLAAQARRSAAEAAVLEAESASARARNEEQRRAELAKTGVATAEEIDYYRQVTDAAEARLLSMRAALQEADAEIERARSFLLGGDDDAGVLAITAPVSGTVYRVHEQNERVVPAGTPLYELSRDNALEIVVDLLTQDAVRVRAGHPLLITGWGGTEVLRGAVERIEPQAFTRISALGVEEQRVNVIGALPAVPAGLGAEYRIDAAIVVWEESDVLTVPASAVFQREGRWQVFVVDDERAHLRSIGTGQRNRDYVQVLNGLEAGAEVVVFPSDLVGDGVRVAVDGTFGQ
jgi:HlyD family secretion protein